MDRIDYPYIPSWCKDPCRTHTLYRPLVQGYLRAPTRVGYSTPKGPPFLDPTPPSPILGSTCRGRNRDTNDVDQDLRCPRESCLPRRSRVPSLTTRFVPVTGEETGPSSTRGNGTVNGTHDRTRTGRGSSRYSTTRGTEP